MAPDLLTSSYGEDLVRRLRDRALILEVSADVFRSISPREGPQGLGAVVRQHWQTLGRVDPSRDFCWVALDSAQDPGNVGTIMRTTDAVGGSGIILLGAGTDPYDPTSVRASMGAAVSLTLIRTTFDELVAWTRLHDVTLVGTSDTADVDYHDVRYRSPLVVLMGNEREGLSDRQQAACGAVVSIPMVGRSDSLNLAVATGVMLYEIFNQQRSHS
jgi:TrmH family RNA methyltransferase